MTTVELESRNDEVDPDDVLKDEVKQLQARIAWDAEKQAKLKEFLETLEETQVAAA